MLSRLREHLGSAGLIVAIVALVAALGGGAYAATGGSGGGKATASAKGKPGPRGKTGKTGPAGPTGPVGPAGPAGSAGPAGPKGDTGTNGVNGKSVTTATAITAECGIPGGITVEVEGTPASKKKVCNGSAGPAGPEGALGTAGTTLPPGATETGVWGVAAGAPLEAAAKANSFPISFPIPLTEAPEPIFVGPTENSKPGCPGRGGGSLPPTGTYVPTIPEADPGKLCVYAHAFEGTTGTPSFIGTVYNEGQWFIEHGTASQVGTLLEVKCVELLECIAVGSWAVTAAEE